MAADDDDENSEPSPPDAHGDMDPLLLELLVCPLTKKPLTYDVERNELISDHANLAYPVSGGITILLPSEARSLMDDET